MTQPFPHQFPQGQLAASHGNRLPGTYLDELSTNSDSEPSDEVSETSEVVENPTSVDTENSSDVSVPETTTIPTVNADAS